MIKRNSTTLPQQCVPLPGGIAALGYSWFCVTILVLIPLAALLLRFASIPPQAVVKALMTPRVIAAVRLSILASASAALINSGFGTLIAWVLIRYRFFGRQLIDSIVDMPLALPTAVSGIALTQLYAANGWIGSGLAALNIKIAFAPAGVLVALCFITLPFSIRSIEPVFAHLDPELEEVAASLGAGRVARLRHVILPQLFPAILTGFALSFARAMGEYGSVVFISGNMPFFTETAPFLIATELQQFDHAGAISLAVLMLAISGAVLLFINLLQNWRRSL